MAHDVFISHSAKDKVVADAMCARLEAGGVRCWIAPRDVRPGATWAAEILRGLEGSRAFVLVFSRDANGSQNVLREVDQAVKSGLPVIPFRIDETLPTKALDFYVSTAHWLDALTPPLDRHLERLRDTLRSLLDLPDLQTSAAPKAGVEVAPPAPRAGRSRAWLLAVAVAALALGALGAWRLFGDRDRAAAPVAPGAVADAGKSLPPAAPAHDPWRVPLDAALAAAKRGDWDEAAARLREAMDAGVPAVALPARLTEGVAAWEADPVLDGVEPPDGATVSSQEALVRGRLRSARPTDRVTVNGADAPLRDGWFARSLPMPAAEALNVEIRVEDRGRARGVPVRLTLSPPRVAPWRAVLDAALAAVRERDWARASARLAEAKDLGAPAVALPAALTEGAAAHTALAEAESLAKADRWEEAERRVPASLPAGLEVPEWLARGLGPARIEVEAPKAGAVVKALEFEVRGRVRGRASDRVRCLGNDFPLDAEGRFAFRLKGKEPGPLAASIDVVAPGGSARGASHALSVTLDPPEPEAAWPPAAVAFLKGFAVPVGTAKDTVTGYPTRIRRTKDGGEMVLIPAGTFQMGAVPGDNGAYADEKPRHAIRLSKAYYLDVNEVTVGQWKRFVSEGGGPALSWRDGATDAMPAHNVTWDEAAYFARWAGAALPTEAQWERAAKGGHDDHVFPWGRTDDVSRRNGSGSDDGFDGLAPVRSFSPNDYGLHDMSGNVWEWCADRFADGYYARSPATDPPGSETGSARVVRGGGWNDLVSHFLRASYRGNDYPTDRYDDHGFRLARSL